MLPKGDLRGVWRVGLVACVVFSLMLLATVPLMAQEKSLEKQLEEAKAAIEDQEWVIRELEKNFFKVVGELNEELDFLRALSSKQLDEIESYLREMESLRLASEKQAKRVGELDAEIKEKAAEITQLEAGVREKEAKLAQLEAGVREKEAKLAQLEAGVREKAAEIAQLEAGIKEKTAEIAQLEAGVREKAAKAEELEALKEEQAKRIERINTLFGKVIDRMRNEIESLSAENAELIAAKDGLQARLDAIDEKHAKLTEDYEGQRGALGRLRDAYQKALVTIAEKDNEIAFWEEQAADLDIEIASLEAEVAKIASLRAQLADCEAYNVRLKRHRLLLGLAFVAAAVMACSAD